MLRSAGVRMMFACRRVAMLAVAGILLVEAAGLGPWWSAPFRVRHSAEQLSKKFTAYSFTWGMSEQLECIFCTLGESKQMQKCTSHEMAY